MANVRLAVALRSALADRINTSLNANSPPGTIKVYTGTQPATGDTALSGNTLLATLTLSNPAAPSASSGVLTLSAITQDSSADNTGTATWARIQDGSGNNVFDCDVSTSGATLNFLSTSFVAGQPIQITSFTITVPAT
jgi:hypothetical protein